MLEEQRMQPGWAVNQYYVELAAIFFSSSFFFFKKKKKVLLVLVQLYNQTKVRQHSQTPLAAKPGE